MKHLIFLLLILLSFQINGQSPIFENFTVNCLDKLKFDSINIDGEIIKYKIVGISKLYTKGTIDYYNAEIILPDFDSKSDDLFINEIMEQIVKETKLISIDEITAFKTCGTRDIYLQAIFPNKNQQETLKKNFIGIYKLKREVE